MYRPRHDHLLSHIASLVGRRPRAATLAVLLAVTAVIGGAVAVGGSFKDDFTVPGIESQQAQDLLEKRFEAQSGTQAVVVFTRRRRSSAPGPSATSTPRSPRSAASRTSPRSRTPSRRPAGSPRTAAPPSHGQLRPDRDRSRRDGSRAARERHLRPASDRASTSPCPASRSTAPPPAGSRSAR